VPEPKGKAKKQAQDRKEEEMWCSGRRKGRFHEDRKKALGGVEVFHREKNPVPVEGVLNGMHL